MATATKCHRCPELLRDSSVTHCGFCREELLLHALRSLAGAGRRSDVAFAVFYLRESIGLSTAEVVQARVRLRRPGADLEAVAREIRDRQAEAVPA